MRSLRSEMLIGRGKRKLPLARPKQRPESRTKKGLMLDTAMKGGARKLESERGSASYARRRNSTRPRSEEHTSELQSLMRISYAVFCLKKKKKKKTTIYTTTEASRRLNKPTTKNNNKQQHS